MSRAPSSAQPYSVKSIIPIVRATAPWTRRGTGHRGWSGRLEANSNAGVSDCVDA